MRAHSLETTADGGLTFTINRTASGMLNIPGFYSSMTAPTSLASFAVPDTGTQLSLGLLGMSFSDFRISGSLGPVGTTWDIPLWQTSMSIVAILQALDVEVSSGIGTPGFTGLSQLVTPGRRFASMGNIAQDIANALLAIRPNGASSTGESAHCLIGNDDIVRTMMMSVAGQTGSSGWRTDDRTGLCVYHFQGLPVYRSAVPTTGMETKLSTLYAANLGPTGLQMVYGYGSLDSFGLQSDVEEIQPLTGRKLTLIHGAFGLALWEREGLVAVTEVAVVPTPALY